jgi:hypothetical protein
VFEPPKRGLLMGVFAANDRLAGLAMYLQNCGTGSEDIAKDPDGYFYTGYQDGRIFRFMVSEGESC